MTKATSKKKSAPTKRSLTLAERTKLIERKLGPSPKILPSQKAENFLGRPEYRSVAKLLNYDPRTKRAKKT